MIMNYRPVRLVRRLRRRAAAAALAGGTVLAAALSALAPPAIASDRVPVQQSEAARFRVVTVTGGLERPWGLAFLPDGRMLVTEKAGRMRIVTASGSLSPPLANLPRVLTRGQAGLLDVAPSPRFAEDRTIFFSYAEPTARGGRTAVARATLGEDALADVRVIFRQAQDPPGGNHWGSRLVFAEDGRLFVTLGDRFDHRDREDWIAQHFFTGGIMPSHGLARRFPESFTVERDWRWSGDHYRRTAEDWLTRFDARQDEIDPILRSVYGTDAALWRRRWRLFFLATAGLFGHAGGAEWGVSHYLLAPVR